MSTLQGCGVEYYISAEGSLSHLFAWCDIGANISACTSDRPSVHSHFNNFHLSMFLCSSAICDCQALHSSCPHHSLPAGTVDR